MRTIAILCISFASVVGRAAPAGAERIKDLVTIEGARANALVGVGIVVGLSGTGDDARSAVTRRSLAQMMRHLGVTIDPGQIKAKNVAAVIVTGELPPFARPGMPIDVTVSSMGTAKSLQGGTLIATPLKGADLQPYALAQGPLSLGGFSVSGRSGSSASKNHATVGRIPGGATVERPAPGELDTSQLVLVLNKPDFTTAARIAAAVDEKFGDGKSETSIAEVRDPAAVTVRVDRGRRRSLVAFVAAIEALEADPDQKARVIIDERTGTIVVGANVRLRPAAIAHGGIQITIAETSTISQPGPLAEGETAVAPESDIEVREEPGSLHALAGATSVGDIAAALGALGVKPRDLVPILQALAAAGSLSAEIEVL